MPGIVSWQDAALLTTHRACCSRRRASGEILPWKFHRPCSSRSTWGKGEGGREGGSERAKIIRQPRRRVGHQLAWCKRVGPTKGRNDAAEGVILFLVPFCSVLRRTPGGLAGFFFRFCAARLCWPLPQPAAAAALPFSPFPRLFSRTHLR